MHDLEISGIGYLENIGIRDKDINISVFRCLRVMVRRFLEFEFSLNRASFIITNIYC